MNYTRNKKRVSNRYNKEIYDPAEKGDFSRCERLVTKGRETKRSS